MNTHNLKQAIGIFPDQEKVEQALLELQNIDFPIHQISIVGHNSNATKNSINTTNQLPTPRIKGAKAGAILGSVGVGLTTLTIGFGILLIPGVGPALALDSILTAFLGSGVVSAAGGLYGAFLGCLDPEKQVKLYRERFQSGDCLVIIEATENQIPFVELILRRCCVRSWQVYDLPKA